MLIRAILAATIPAALAVAAISTASAQYPPPTGNCVVTASATATETGDGVTITVTVRDIEGNPVAGELVSLGVESQPGSGASITPTSATTGADGTVHATLNVGTDPGTVVVVALAEDVACRATVGVAGGEVAGEITLPNTGSGLADGTNLGGLIIALIIAGALLFVAGRGRHRA
jgi:hypothetical protein